MKIIVLTCIYGRLQTVKYAISRTPNVERLIIYSDTNDKFELPNSKWVKFQNKPISRKWQKGVNELRNFDFDYVIMMGSDDWFCEDFIPLIEKYKGYDMIGFNDIYFEDVINDKAYYWDGYTDKNKTAGAGRCYSKEFLERINYKLWDVSINKGLDSASNKVLELNKAKIKVLNCKANGVFLCDVKDGLGLTGLHRFRNLKKL